MHAAHAARTLKALAWLRPIRASHERRQVNTASMRFKSTGGGCCDAPSRRSLCPPSPSPYPSPSVTRLDSAPCGICAVTPACAVHHLRRDASMRHAPRATRRASACSALRAPQTCMRARDAATSAGAEGAGLQSLAARLTSVCTADVRLCVCVPVYVPPVPSLGRSSAQEGEAPTRPPQPPPILNAWAPPPPDTGAFAAMAMVVAVAGA